MTEDCPLCYQPLLDSQELCVKYNGYHQKCMDEQKRREAANICIACGINESPGRNIACDGCRHDTSGVYQGYPGP